MSYRTDPHWQAAWSEYVADPREEETADEIQTRRVRAVFAMHDIEKRYEAASTDA